MKCANVITSIALALGALSPVAIAETATDAQWNVGLSFEQHAYLRDGLFLERQILDQGLLTLSVGSQRVMAKDVDGQLKGRVAADGAIGYRGRARLAQGIEERLGMQLGYQTYRMGTDSSTKGYNYVDIYTGLGMQQGKLTFFTDLALRSNFFGASTEVMQGDKRVEDSYLYPRFGIAYGF